MIPPKLGRPRFPKSAPWTRHVPSSTDQTGHTRAPDRLRERLAPSQIWSWRGLLVPARIVLRACTFHTRTTPKGTERPWLALSRSPRKPPSQPILERICDGSHFWQLQVASPRNGSNTPRRRFFARFPKHLCLAGTPNTDLKRCHQALDRQWGRRLEARVLSSTPGRTNRGRVYIPTCIEAPWKENQNVS
ncbi:hypothetical protein CI102_14456 [Trichoderma harzianum]|uniref:Uncharacterized protein n=1 Tax=Trichoderma harzianum CBS 226.95 TaxID=983964 RepID=A0A2T4APN6_TRIHA|nr:hypothetical protein M431DRAFT_293465 [Trichoderma harzianum CBS 226.95]PKK42488.1 hypothetical protein CI102_14456 [Trichoderma harzianum]PTB59034.1 hypothetical protein M431DRAFT_293465 [Trichoderma harzianum CBS 226.95]